MNAQTESIRGRSNQRGAVLYLVAAMMVVFLGIAALAVDLGAWYVARSEAQRAAEAGAHAGASIFLHAPGDATGARAEAEVFAEQNTVRWVTPDVFPDDDIDVIVDSQKVRVRVQRSTARGNPIGTMFAKAMGMNTVDISAVAAAQVWPANFVPCVLPFAIPDRWAETAGPWPLGENQPWQPDTDDSFDVENDPDDQYVPFYSDPVTLTANSAFTGYSPMDKGYLIRIYAGDPQEAPQPSWWHPFAQPGGQGANILREAIVGCVEGFADAGYGIGEDVDTEPGAQVGPIRQGFEELMSLYPDEAWNDGMNCVVSTSLGPANGCITSGRTRPLVLYDPSDPPDLGRKPLTIANIAGVFVEGITPGGGNNLEVWVRFVDYTKVQPGQIWSDSDAFLKVLRIIE